MINQSSSMNQLAPNFTTSQQAQDRHNEQAREKGHRETDLSESFSSLDNLKRSIALHMQTLSPGGYLYERRNRFYGTRGYEWYSAEFARAEHVLDTLKNRLEYTTSETEAQSIISELRLAMQDIFDANERAMLQYAEEQARQDAEREAQERHDRKIQDKSLETMRLFTQAINNSFSISQSAIMNDIIQGSHNLFNSYFRGEISGRHLVEKLNSQIPPNQQRNMSFTHNSEGFGVASNHHNDSNPYTPIDDRPPVLERNIERENYLADRAHTEAREDSRIQRMVVDAQRAGINPSALFGSGSGGGVTSGASQEQSEEEEDPFMRMMMMLMLVSRAMR